MARQSLRVACLLLFFWLVTEDDGCIRVSKVGPFVARVAVFVVVSKVIRRGQGIAAFCRRLDKRFFDW